MGIDQAIVSVTLVALATFACEVGGDDEPADANDELAEFSLCDPTLAEFDGDVVPQAGVEIDLTDDSCAAVSGPPPSDQLVIDDFGGAFGGSGSGLRVAGLSAGEFTNEEKASFCSKGCPPTYRSSSSSSRPRAHPSSPSSSPSRRMDRRSPTRRSGSGDDATPVTEYRVSRHSLARLCIFGRAEGERRH